MSVKFQGICDIYVPIFAMYFPYSVCEINFVYILFCLALYKNIQIATYNFCSINNTLVFLNPKYLIESRLLIPSFVAAIATYCTS